MSIRKYKKILLNSLGDIWAKTSIIRGFFGGGGTPFGWGTPFIYIGTLVFTFLLILFLTILGHVITFPCKKHNASNILLLHIHYMGKNLWTSDHHTHIWGFPQNVATNLEEHNSLEYLCKL